jgi:two-component system response regulator RegA
MTTASERRDNRTLLIVDDDERFRVRLMQAFAARGFEVRGAADYQEAVASATDDSPELAVVDLRLPGGSGVDLIRELKGLDSTTNVVVLTGYGSIATAVESVRAGATTYLTKPVDADQIAYAFDGSGALPSAPQVVPSLARVEWEHIQRVLADCDGNVSRAAKLLGIHRRSLQRKLAKDPAPR